MVSYVPLTWKWPWRERESHHKKYCVPSKAYGWLTMGSYVACSSPLLHGEWFPVAPHRIAFPGWSTLPTHPNTRNCTGGFFPFTMCKDKNYVPSEEPILSVLAWVIDLIDRQQGQSCESCRDVIQDILQGQIILHHWLSMNESTASNSEMQQMHPLWLNPQQRLIGKRQRKSSESYRDTMGSPLRGLWILSTWEVSLIGLF